LDCNLRFYACQSSIIKIFDLTNLSSSIILHIMNETTNTKNTNEGVEMTLNLNLTPEEQASADAWLQEQISRPALPKGQLDILIARKIRRESK